jgi:tetratricopeptide (TPR) repeat protein
MSKKRSTKKSSRPEPSAPASHSSKIIVGIVLASVLLAVGLVASLRKNTSGSPPSLKPVAVREEQPYTSRPAGTITFTKEIAPIVFKECAPCHRPGQSGPFSLLTYTDYQKRLKQIGELTASRTMPPWPLEPGYGEFAHERRLTSQELGLIQQWVQEGGREGDPKDLPAPPQWSEGWTLGKPDLVVTLAKPYILPGDGKDVYRNVVIPVPLAANRFVRGIELLPGNSRVVHHAFINVDQTGQSRRLAEKQNPPGFDGMELPESALMPGGQLLGWQPGKVPEMSPPGLSWILKTNSDVVLQMHLNPSGKPESVQPSIGFYFSDQPPTNSAFRIKLAALELDIPAGEGNYIAEQSYVLPVDLSLTRVGAHAHYLGKDLQGYAVLPSGEQKPLMRIKNWNFQWQGDYQYAEPVYLPKGSKLVLRFAYDNSTNNIQNPNHPPARVRYGLQTTDEMGELYFQAVPNNAHDYVTLAKDFSEKFLQVSIGYYNFRLRFDENDEFAHVRLARILMSQGKLSETLEHLNTAIAAHPNSDQAHYELGCLYLAQNQLQKAFEEFQTVTRLNPSDNQAYGNLGLICLRTQHLDQARTYFETAVQINPDDTAALNQLNLLRRAR